jgi:allophanate hydrolase subunit 2
MGMRVLGKSLENLVNSNIPSEGIIKGAIQVPGDGNPIILLSDHPGVDTQKLVQLFPLIMMI